MDFEIGFFFLSLILVSSSQLYLEVLLTRIFSITQGYHWAFLIVGLALLGSGLSGTYLIFRKKLSKEKGIELLRYLSLFYPLCIVLAYIEITFLPFDPYLIPWSGFQLFLFFLNLMSFLTPFFFSGLIVSVSLIIFSERHSILYSATFIGASIGSILALLVLPLVGEFNALIISILLGLLASLLLCRGSLKYITISSIFLLFSLYLLISSPFAIPPKLSPYKDLAQILRFPQTKILETQRNASSRVDVIESPAIRYAPGLSYKYKGTIPSGLGITIDGENLKAIVTSNHFTGSLPQAVVYLLRREPKVLIIEPIGGLDIVLALNRSTNDITVIFENPIMINILKRYIPEISRVRFIAENPRVYLSEMRGLFDIIQFSLQESFYIVASGSYSLRENYIYTVEGFKSVYTHLKPDGVILFTRWLQRPPTEELRLFNIILTGLRELGVIKPEKRVIAFRSLNTMTFLVKNGEFTPREIDIIKTFTESLSFDLVYLYRIKPTETNRFNVLQEDIYYEYFQMLLHKKGFSDIYPFRIDPPRDDRPFFFHFFKKDQVSAIVKNWGHTWQPFGGAGYIIILAIISLIILISLVFILLPFLMKRVKMPRTYKLLNLSLYFFAIGLAYLFIEIPIMQRFILYLGRPVYSFSLTLASILFFSGLGSMYAVRLKRYPLIFLLGGTIIILAIILSFILDNTLGYPFYMRVVISICIIGLLGFLMGFPFPTGLEKARIHSTDTIPWCWAINGFASVLSSFLSTILAIYIGFSSIIAIGGFLYIIAGLVFYLTPDKGDK